LTICHPHNLIETGQPGTEKNFGIRVTLPEGDTFARMLGEDWEQLHWYRDEAERDRAFDNMATRHGYYRKTDSPTQVLSKIVR